MIQVRKDNGAQYALGRFDDVDLEGSGAYYSSYC